MDAKQIQAVIEEVIKEVLQAKAAATQPTPARQPISQSVSQYINKPANQTSPVAHQTNQITNQKSQAYQSEIQASQPANQPTSQHKWQPIGQAGTAANQTNQLASQYQPNIAQENIQKLYPKQDKAVPPPTSIPASGQSDLKQAAKDNGLLLDNPIDAAALVRMKSHTSARIGVGKAGARLKTDTMLKLRADHAAARDAVFNDVGQEYIDKLGLSQIVTLCQDKNEYLTRPDLGRQFDPKELEKIVSIAGTGCDVLIYASDGLSSTAITHNLHNILPVLLDGLKAKGLKVAQPFFVKFGRVGAMDSIAQATGAAVTCVLIGERPGLATAESMSAYIAYNATVGMPEARRTVVSNIHKGGTAAVEAGAYICDIIHTIYKSKASGVELLARSSQ